MRSCRLPRFFFNVHDGVNARDETGTDIRDTDAARLEAVRYSGDLLERHPDAFWIQDDWRMEVSDATGSILFAIHVSAVQAPALHGWTFGRECVPKA